MKKRILLPLLAGLVILTTAVSYKSDFFEIAKQIEIFTDAYKQINMDYVDEVSPGELMDVALKSMFAHLDPYTNFWSAQDVQEGRLMHSANYTGIGAVVQSQKENLLIKEVFKDFPADKAGLKAGDRILQIGDIEVKGFDDDAAELLKGAPGTSVELRFSRQGQIQNTTLKRENKPQKLVPFYQLFDNQIGYIRLTQFGETTSQEVGTALRKLKGEGAEKIILDLRGNPGGLLSEAVNTVNLFIPKGEKIVSTKSIVDKYNRTYLTQNEPIDTEIPLAVLIDGHSASASEIVSGSMQDLDRGVVIGSRSFGKGLVQRVRPLKYGTQMKLTISRYYTPSGRGIQALDYWHRDEQGNPIRTKAEDYREFKTKNGRSVYDGGGIAPDVKVTATEIDGVTRALLEKNAIFDFATDYYYRHKLEDLDQFSLTDTDFSDFKKFIQKTDFQYETPLEKALVKAFEESVNDELKEKIATDYQNLLQSIEKTKAQEIEDNKVQIMQQLTDEIIKRYYYREGFYTYSLQHNPGIQKAVEILNDAPKLENILR